LDFHKQKGVAIYIVKKKIDRTLHPLNTSENHLTQHPGFWRWGEL
jgi:hypothetical protein